jgi:hypothetical protein
MTLWWVVIGVGVLALGLIVWALVDGSKKKSADGTPHGGSAENKPDEASDDKTAVDSNQKTAFDKQA